MWVAESPLETGTSWSAPKPAPPRRGVPHPKDGGQGRVSVPGGGGRQEPPRLWGAVSSADPAAAKASILCVCPTPMR